MIMYKRVDEQLENEPPIEGNFEPENNENNVQVADSNSEQSQPPAQQPPTQPPTSTQPQPNLDPNGYYNPFPPAPTPDESNTMNKQSSNGDKLGNTLKYTFIAVGGLLIVVLIITCIVLIIKRIKENNEDDTPEIYYRSGSNHDRSIDKSSKNSRSYMNSIEHIQYKNLNIPDDSINDIDIYSPSINSFSNYSLSQTAIHSNGMNGMNGNLMNPAKAYDNMYDFKKGNPNPYNNNYYDDKPKYSFMDVPLTNANYDPNPNFYFNKKGSLDEDEFINGSL